MDLRSVEARAVIGRAQLGDLKALDTLLEALQSPLYAHILGIVRDHDAAMDVTQDTLLLVARKITWLRDPQWLRAWAYRIATRAAVRHARIEKPWREALRETSRLPDAGAGLDGTWDVTTLLARGEAGAAIRDLLQTLPPASQVVLRMHYLEDMTFAEVAEALEIPVGTVKSRLAYGLTILRDRVGGVQALTPWPP